jgi:hypothetical protein
MPDPCQCVFDVFCDQIDFLGDTNDMLNLKLFPKYKDPTPVLSHQVPVCIINLENVVDKYWDMTTRRVRFNTSIDA